MAHSTITLSSGRQQFKDAALLAAVILLCKVGRTTLASGTEDDRELQRMLEEWRTHCSHYEGTGCINLDMTVLARSPAQRRRFLELIIATEEYVASFPDNIPAEEINPLIIARPGDRLFEFHPKQTALQSLGKLRTLVTAPLP